MKGHIFKVVATAMLWMLCHVAQAGSVTYVYTDPQGTPLAEADASGNITARFDYAPYGTAVASLSPAPNGPGYTGHVNDPDTGLVYMQARYYDPAVGRFLSTDPVTPSAGNALNFSRYAYANNNPIANTDPDGRETGPAFRQELTDRTPFVMHGSGSPGDVGEIMVSVIPVVSDISNVVDAARNPTLGNVAIAVVGAIPEVGGIVAKGMKEAGAVEKVGTESEKIASRASRMQREVERGQAPRNIDRVDPAHNSRGAQDHVHFKDGTAMNRDGTIHDARNGTPAPSNNDKEWLEGHGWPKEPRQN